MRARFSFLALLLAAAAAAWADDSTPGAKGADGPQAKDAAPAQDTGDADEPKAPGEAKEKPPAGDAAKGAKTPAKKPESKSAKDAPAAKGKDAPVAQSSAVPRALPKSLEEALRILSRRRTDVDFREMALDDVVTFLSKVGGVNAMVSPEYRRKVGSNLPVVTLTLRDVTLRQLAELTAKTSGTSLAFRDGVLQFTTPEDARGKPVLHIFTLADLTFRIRNFPGPDIQLHLASAEFVQEEESDQETAFDDADKIVELVKKFTGKDTWDDEDVSITADDKRMIVRQYPKVLKEIGAFLAVLRAAK